MAHSIISPANPAIKALKALHTKKGRQDQGLFLAEGLRLVLEAAEADVWPQILLFAPATEGRSKQADLVRRAEHHGVRCIETTASILAAVSKRDNPQTVIAAYRQRLSNLADLAPARLVIALQQVRDPGNLGTILRTADAIGADGVVLLDVTCDPFSVEAVRASMGSLFAVKLARAEFPVFNAWRRTVGAQMVGLSLKGTFGPQPYDHSSPTVLLMGNEQSGLLPEHEAACDALVRLPMRGKADSLNLAVATAVTAYDLWRRRDYEGHHD
ncbi:MAG: TrmH family RNA methyltransferase [Caulobacterales bacterium]|jgi:TrmH family RNA methyltransferase